MQKQHGGGVGTGISCGVDSFYSVLKHFDIEYPNQKLTHLCIFNNGMRTSYKEEKVYERAEAVAKEFGLPLIKVKSNLKNFIKQSNARTHTYKDVLTIYALQKLFRVYYYGSAFFFAHCSLEENLYADPAHFDPLLLDCFSTSKLRIISSGAEGDRNDKIDFIADNPIVQKYLYVCIKEGSTNCNRCSKCMRTLLSLDAADKLDNFRESFDIDGYIKMRKKFYRSLNKIIEKNPEDPMFVKTYKILYERHKKFFDSLNAKKE